MRALVVATLIGVFAGLQQTPVLEGDPGGGQKWRALAVEGDQGGGQKQGASQGISGDPGGGQRWAPSLATEGDLGGGQ